MDRSFIYVSVFTIAVVLTFAWVTEIVTNISGLGGVQASVEGVNPEAGEALYWGIAKCSTCHSMGTRGSAIRGPNHEDVYITAGDRAAEIGLETPTEYFVRSIAYPEEYVVEGYKAEMPEVYLPPISLQPDQVRAIITYLQSQGGEPDPSAIELPDVILDAAGSAGEAEPFAAYADGNAARGETLFFDLDGQAGCASCHTFDGKGGDVGPELTDEATVRPLQYIIESILFPSAVIASGYEPVLIRTFDGRTLNGVLRAEDDVSLTLVTKEGEEITASKSDIDRRGEDPPSLMPDNFGDLLTMTDFHDILAFLTAAFRAEQEQAEEPAAE
tara:strand:+ start:488 stop:1474 length:987 start_codon:yes stop_codon:yes gene_type:complete